MYIIILIYWKPYTTCNYLILFLYICFVMLKLNQLLLYLSMYYYKF